MTREIRYDPEGHDRTPKYIDHGHWPRKAAWLATAVLVTPAALIQIGAQWVADTLEHVARWMGRLHTWSHPCLYKQRGESYDDYLGRVRTITTGQPPVAEPVRVNPARKGES